MEVVQHEQGSLSGHLHRDLVWTTLGLMFSYFYGYSGLTDSNFASAYTAALIRQSKPIGLLCTVHRTFFAVTASAQT